jgi:predicted dehydrogenase
MIKIALVGTGNVATSSYLPYLAKQEGVALSFYNRTRAKAEAAASRFGGSVAGSLRELVEAEPDAVLVLTRETDRYEAALALLELRPKRLFFEKPLVAMRGQANVEEADFVKGREILQRAGMAGVETAMVFNYRFFDQTLKASQIVAARSWGQATNVSALVHYACWSHCIDLVLCFAGAVSEVTALAGHQERGWTGQGGARDIAAAFRTEAEATGTIIGTNGLDFKMPLFELTLAFERGRLHMRDLDGDQEVLDYGTRQHEVYQVSRDSSRWDHYNASFARSLEGYLGSIRAGGPPPIPGIAGLRELQFEAGLKRSAAEGRPVVLAEEFPLDL